MHGFLIHTTDQRLIVRNYDYIKHENPGWWQDNLHHVSSFWEFDTDDAEGMKAIMYSLRRISEQLLITRMDVELFCKSVGFDLDKFIRENATPHTHSARMKNQNWDSSEISAGGGFSQGPSSNDGFKKLNESKD